MTIDKDKAIELVSKDWSEYFNLPEDLREYEEILNIVLRADDLFANGSRYFHHLFWRDDQKINEINLLEYEDVLTLVEEAQDNFQDNLDFPDSNIPAYLMSEDEIVERYNLHIEIDDFDGEFMDEVGTDEAENIRERLELVIDDRVYSSLRRYFADERIANYIALIPENPSTDPKQIMAACLIHIDNLFLAPKEFFTEENLHLIFEEHFKALDIIPRQTWWYSSDIDKLLAHINSFLPLANLNTDSALIQSIMKVDQNKKSLASIIDISAIDGKSSDHFNDEMPLEDYSNEALAEHMKKKPFDFRKLSEDQKNIRSVALNAVQGHGHLLENCNEEFRSDPEFVLAAVKYNGSCIKYALGGLQDDRDFIQKCVEADGYTLEHINNQDFLNDKALALLAIDNYGSAFGIINKLSDNLKNDPEIILAGLKKDRSSLSAASEALHNDRDFILECIKINGDCFGVIVNDEFKNDREIVEQALDNLSEEVLKWDSVANGIAFNISDELKKDRSIANKILKANPYTIDYFSHFDFTKQEILEFIQTNTKTYRHLPEHFKNDLDIVSLVIEKDPNMFSEMKVELKDNKDLALKAVSTLSLLYVELNKELKADKDILDIILNKPVKRTN